MTDFVKCCSMARLVRNTKMWLAEDLLCLAEGRLPVWIPWVRVVGREGIGVYLLG